MKVIDNASQSQIEAAATYNRYEIDKLLIKLLTINLISNEKEVFSSKKNNLGKLNDVCTLHTQQTIQIL